MAARPHSHLSFPTPPPLFLSAPFLFSPSPKISLSYQQRHSMASPVGKPFSPPYPQYGGGGGEVTKARNCYLGQCIYKEKRLYIFSFSWNNNTKLLFRLSPPLPPVRGGGGEVMKARNCYLGQCIYKEKRLYIFSFSWNNNTKLLLFFLYSKILIISLELRKYEAFTACI